MIAEKNDNSDDIQIFILWLFLIIFIVLTFLHIISFFFIEYKKNTFHA